MANTMTLDLDVLKKLKPDIYSQIIDGTLKKKDIVQIFECLTEIAEAYETLTCNDYEISNYEDRFKTPKKNNVVSLSMWKSTHPKTDPEPPQAG